MRACASSPLHARTWADCMHILAAQATCGQQAALRHLRSPTERCWSGTKPGLCQDCLRSAAVRASASASTSPDCRITSSQSAPHNCMPLMGRRSCAAWRSPTPLHPFDGETVLCSAGQPQRSPDGGGVVVEADDGVAGVGLQGGLDQLEQGMRHGLAVQDDVGPEKPVAAAARTRASAEVFCRGKCCT